MPISLLIMRNSRRLLPIGGVVLFTFMLTLVVDMTACPQVADLPQLTCATADSHESAHIGDDGAPYLSTGIARRAPAATSVAKYLKAKSMLPCQPWELATTHLTTPLYQRAGFPVHALAATACYAIHPRPPTPLTL